jgi:hypothetical protein
MKSEIVDFETALCIDTCSSTGVSPEVHWIWPGEVVCDVSSAATLSLKGTADWVIDASKDLEALGRLQQGWDSYGGLPLQQKSKDFAVRAIGWLDKKSLPSPTVVLGSSGTVQLEWRGRGKELDIDLGTGTAIDYVTVDAQGRIDEGREENNLVGRLCELAAWFLHDNSRYSNE